MENKLKPWVASLGGLSSSIGRAEGLPFDFPRLSLDLQGLVFGPRGFILLGGVTSKRWEGRSFWNYGNHLGWFCNEFFDEESWKIELQPASWNQT